MVVGVGVTAAVGGVTAAVGGGCRVWEELVVAGVWWGEGNWWWEWA